MDFVWAVVYPLRGKRWYLRWPLVAATILMPIVGLIFGFGYVVACVRRIAQDDYDLPPFALYPSEGFYILISALFHCLVWFLIAAPIAALVDHLGFSDTTENRISGVLLLVFTLHFVIGGLRYALTDNDRMLFDVAGNVRIFWRNKWRVSYTIIQAIFYGFAVAGVMFGIFAVTAEFLRAFLHMRFFDDNLPSLIITLIAFFLVYPGMPVLGAAYLLGQLARRLDLGDEKAKRKNGALQHAIN